MIRTVSLRLFLQWCSPYRQQQQRTDHSESAQWRRCVPRGPKSRIVAVVHGPVGRSRAAVDPHRSQTAWRLARLPCPGFTPRPPGSRLGSGEGACHSRPSLGGEDKSLSLPLLCAEVALNSVRLHPASSVTSPSFPPSALRRTRYIAPAVIPQ